MSHVWFQQLDRAVGLSNLVLATCAKVLLDLAFFTPLWCVAFLGAMTLMQGQGPREAGRRIRAEGLELYTGNLLVWLPANVVIYSVVPLELRVPAFGIYNLVYTIFLSFWSERRHCRAEEVERGLLDGVSSLVADLLQSYPARWARHRLGCGACGGEGDGAVRPGVRGPGAPGGGGRANGRVPVLPRDGERGVPAVLRREPLGHRRGAGQAGAGRVRRQGRARALPRRAAPERGPVKRPRRPSQGAHRSGAGT